MKLAAMMVVKDEVWRYLQPCLDHLLEFCDAVCILDDGSTDEFREIDWAPPNGVHILRQSESTFYQHEGNTRQTLLDWTMMASPTHVLAIDADEFVADGQALRQALGQPSPRGVWRLNMQEVWGASDDAIILRQDGGWKEHGIGIAFWVPPDHFTNRVLRRHWRIPDRALACGRVPITVAMNSNRTFEPPVTDILHFGWACERDRQARYARYVEHDGGRHHAGSHLESIMWADSRVNLTSRSWPDGLASVQQRLVERVNQA